MSINVRTNSISTYKFSKIFKGSHEKVRLSIYTNRLTPTLGNIGKGQKTGTTPLWSINYKIEVRHSSYLYL